MKFPSKLLLRAALLLPALTTGAPAASPASEIPPEVETRLTTLERQVLELAYENADLKRQLGVNHPRPSPPSSESRLRKLSIGGFMQAQAEFGHATDTRWNGTRDRFYFRRVRVHLAGTLAGEMDFKAELDLQGNTLGATTGLLARANEIYINWHRYPAFNLRLGQLKPAFGAESLESDTTLLTIERSLVSDRLTDGRQLGVATAGSLSDGRFRYYAVLANGNGANASANDNDRFQKSLRFTFAPPLPGQDRLVLGIDRLWANDSRVSKPGLGFSGDYFGGRRDSWGVDARWTCGSVGLDAELLQGTFHPDRSMARAPFDARGWQATLSWFFVPSRLQAVFRREEFNPDTAVGGNTVRTNVLGLNWRLRGDDIKLMFNYLDGPAFGDVRDRGRLLSRVQILY